MGIEVAETIHPENWMALAHELPDWVRDQFPAACNCARPERCSCRLPVCVRSGYAVPAGRAGQERDKDGGDHSREAAGCSTPAGSLRTRRYFLPQLWGV